MLLTPRSMRMKAFTTGWRKPRPVATVAMTRQSKENFLLRGKKKLGHILNLQYSVNFKTKINTNANDSDNSHQAGIWKLLPGLKGQKKRTDQLQRLLQILPPVLFDWIESNLNFSALGNSSTGYSALDSNWEINFKPIKCYLFSFQSCFKWICIFAWTSLSPPLFSAKILKLGICCAISAYSPELC